MPARGRADLSGGTSESSSDTNKNIRAQRYNAHHALWHGAHIQHATVPGKLEREDSITDPARALAQKHRSVIHGNVPTEYTTLYISVDNDNNFRCPEGARKV